MIDWRFSLVFDLPVKKKKKSFQTCSTAELKQTEVQIPEQFYQVRPMSS